jgi:hypothetical protein
VVKHDAGAPRSCPPPYIKRLTATTTAMSTTTATSTTVSKIYSTATIVSTYTTQIPTAIVTETSTTTQVGPLIYITNTEINADCTVQTIDTVFRTMTETAMFRPTGTDHSEIPPSNELNKYGDIPSWAWLFISGAFLLGLLVYAVGGLFAKDGEVQNLHTEIEDLRARNATLSTENEA